MPASQSSILKQDPDDFDSYIQDTATTPPGKRRRLIHHLTDGDWNGKDIIRIDRLENDAISINGWAMIERR